MFWSSNLKTAQKQEAELAPGDSVTWWEMWLETGSGKGQH